MGRLKDRLLLGLAGLTRRWPLRGSSRLLDLIYHPFRRQEDWLETVIPFEDDLRLHIDTRCRLEYHILFFGRYEPEITREIRELIRPGAVAIDVGANIGAHAVVMARCAGPQGRVLAYEPHPETCGRLRRNLELNGLLNTDVREVALSDRSGSLALYSYGGADAHLVASALPQNFDKARDSIPVGLRDVVEMQVPQRTLDEEVAGSALERLDLIKIDVEGLDYRVLLGGRATLERHRPHIIFEFNPRTWHNAGDCWDESQQWLEAVGYALFTLGPDGRVPVTRSLEEYHNVLAVPDLSVQPLRPS